MPSMRRLLTYPKGARPGVPPGLVFHSEALDDLSGQVVREVVGDAAIVVQVQLACGGVIDVLDAGHKVRLYGFHCLINDVIDLLTATQPIELMNDDV